MDYFTFVHVLNLKNKKSTPYIALEVLADFGRGWGYISISFVLVYAYNKLKHFYGYLYPVPYVTAPKTVTIVLLKRWLLP